MKAVLPKYRLGVIVTVLLLSAVLSACVSHEPKTDPFFDEWRAKAENSKPYTPSPRKSMPAETQPPADHGEHKEGVATPLASTSQPPATNDAPLDLPKTPLSVRFIDDDLATSLRTMARIAKQNILISPSVQGKLNLQTQETPWDTVFLGIISSYGLKLVQENNLLHVMSMSDLKQQVEQKTLQLQEQQVSPLITKIVPIEFSDPKTIAESVTQLLSTDKDGKARGSASMDQHSRSLIIRETKDNMEKLLALVRELDRPTAQVLIEAHIVETTKDTARELGIQWGAMSAQGVLGDSRLNLNPGSAAATYVAGTPGTAGTPGSAGTSASFATPPSPGATATTGTAATDGTAGTAGTPATPAQLIYPATGATTIGQNVSLAASAIKGISPASIGLIANGGDLLLNVQLSALQREGKLNILSSPSIATLDNTEAVIESGKSVPFQTIEDQKTQITYKDATLNLTVIPHVISDQIIKLNIVAKKDEVDLANNVAGNPFIIKKLAKTQLIVENNATVVLAGLSKETQSGSNAGVPGMKDVPGLGWLFKKDSSSKEFEELLIFITPKILTRPEDQAREVAKP